MAKFAEGAIKEEKNESQTLFISVAIELTGIRNLTCAYLPYLQAFSFFIIVPVTRVGWDIAVLLEVGQIFFDRNGRGAKRA